MKKLFSLMLAGCLLFGLAACDVSSDKKTEPAAYPVKVASVTVQKAPEKVASLSPSLTEILFEQGYGEKIVVRTDDAAYPEAAADIPSAGRTGHIDMEKLLAQEPDTILTHESLSKNETTALEAAGIQVIVLPMAKSLTELQELYQTLGLLFYGALEGKEIGDAAYAPIKAALDEISAKLPEQASFLYLIDLKGIAATGDTFESSLLSLFGRNTAENDAGYAFDPKTAAEKNPDIILIAQPYGLPHLEQDANFKSLAAVKNKKVVQVDGTLFAVQSSRVVTAVEEIARTLYPEQFPEESSSEADAVSSDAASSAVSSGASSRKQSSGKS